MGSQAGQRSQEVRGTSNQPTSLPSSSLTRFPGYFLISIQTPQPTPAHL